SCIRAARAGRADMTVLTGSLLSRRQAWPCMRALGQTVSAALADFVVGLDPLAALVVLVARVRSNFGAVQREDIAENIVASVHHDCVLEGDDIAVPAAAGTRTGRTAGAVEDDVDEMAGFGVVAEILSDMVWRRVRRAGLFVVADHDPVTAARLLAVVPGSRRMSRLHQEIAGAGPITDEGAQLIQLCRHIVLRICRPEVQQGRGARNGGIEGGGGRFHEQGLRESDGIGYSEENRKS